MFNESIYQVHLLTLTRFRMIKERLMSMWQVVISLLSCLHFSYLLILLSHSSSVETALLLRLLSEQLQPLQWLISLVQSAVLKYGNTGALSAFLYCLMSVRKSRVVCSTCVRWTYMWCSSWCSQELGPVLCLWCHTMRYTLSGPVWWFWSVLGPK